jgi:hypothetical protein
MLTLDKLVFDPSSPGDGASLGAYLRASDGTLLTHTDVGGKKALDVSIADGVNVEVDLSHVDDSVKIGDGTDLMAVNADGSINAIVAATDLDIRDLSHAQDSVKIGDGTDLLAVNADGSINVNASPTAMASAARGATSVTTTATKIIATNLANRRKVIVQNLGTKDMFFGHNNTVTAANGIKVGAGASAELEFGPSLDCYGITAAGTADVRYLEVA